MPNDPAIDYQRLFQVLPGRYIVFAADDPDFTVVDESEAHAEMALVRRQDVIGKPLLKAFPDKSEKFRKTGVSDLVESFRKVVRTGKPDHQPLMRYSLKKADGKYEEHIFRVVHYPLCDDKGKVVGVYQTSTDITKEANESDRLERAEQQLHEALAIARVGTWVWDIKGDKVITDRNLAQLFGVSYEEAAAGLPLSVFTDSIHPADRDRIVKEIQHTIRTKGMFESEYRTLGSDDSIHWLLARGRIETDSKGQPAVFPGVLLDITDRKRAEESRSFLVDATTILAGSLHYRQTLKKVASLAVPRVADWCTIDMIGDKGRLQQVAMAHKNHDTLRWAREQRRKYGPDDIHINQAFERLVHTGKPEFVSAINDEILRKMTKTKEQLELARRLETSSLIRVPLRREETIVGVLTLVGTEGRHFTEDDLNMALELANHASLSISNAYLFDTTRSELKKREKLEERLIKMNERLERRVRERTAKLEELNGQLNRSNRELQDFAYVASHDLQEPLRKIQAFGNLLEQEYGSKLDDGKDYLDRMRNAAARMSDLISDLLSFSRVTTQVRPFVPTDLGQVVEEILSDLETRLADTGGTVEVGDLPVVDADPMQMRQVFQNLVSNALKFHKPDAAPVVTIGASAKTVNGVRCVAIEVSDNGVGFDEKYLDRIFAVFQRLHGRDQFEGTGIGLAVCRKIVERHHGTVTARSKPGEGATFVILLPLRQPEPETTAAAVAVTTSVTNKTPSKGTRI